MTSPSEARTSDVISVKGFVKRVRRTGTVAMDVKTSIDSIAREAYQLAIANKRKSWAKRWLRANGYWL